MNEARLKLQDQELMNSFVTTLKLVALTNFLQFLVLIGDLANLPYFVPVIRSYIFYHYILPILLLVDLVFTYKLLNLLYMIKNEKVNTIIFGLYLFISGITRVFTFIEVFGFNEFGYIFYFILISGTLFAYLLYMGTAGIDLIHFEKLRMLAILILLSPIGLLSQNLSQLFAGLKLMSLFPASVIYFILATDLPSHLNDAETNPESNIMISRA